MKRPGICLLIFYLVFQCFCGSLLAASKHKDSEPTKAVDTPKAIFIDSRLMVLVHPLFNAYDTSTGRFKGTPSEPLIKYKGERKEFAEKTKKLEEELLKSSEELKNNLKKVPFKDRLMIERKYIEEKKEKEAKLEAMKARVYYSKLVPTHRGMTRYNSIYPECAKIKDTIFKIVNNLKKKYNTEIVIDVADLLPITPTNEKKVVVFDDSTIKNYYNKKNEGKDLSQFVRKADAYWADKFGIDADVIPFGAVDVRLEAIKLMEEEVKGYILWDWEK